jgi:hypothetical protein
VSKRYQGGVLGVGFNPLQAPNAPTIGTATAGGASASVAFTAPTCVGGSAITRYTATANCGVRFATGTSSPLTVGCLTVGTTYTFRVFATNSYGPSAFSAASNGVVPVTPVGQVAYTTAGTYSWVAPSGVTSVSIVTVGAGGNGSQGYKYTISECCATYCRSIAGAGGRGGALAYTNNATVVPGQSYTLNVPAEGASTPADFITAGATVVVRARSGAGGGTVAVGTGGSGGLGGGGYCSYYGGDAGGGGGGGAAGYGAGSSGNAGRGADGSNPGALGSTGACGGGGGGGGSYNNYGGLGGGVGILGQGASGAGGSYSSGSGLAGVAGSGGTSNLYGGGGSGGPVQGTTYQLGQPGGRGAVRIIWPGTTRSFPSTNTGNL